MPIGEAIPDRKITDDHKAFPDRGGGGGQVSSTYQTELNEYKTTIINNVTISEATELVRGEVEQRNHAERRAKAYVGDYQQLFDFDIDDDIIVTTGTWDDVNFQHEVISTPGAQEIPLSGGAASWSFTPTGAIAGVYMVGVHLELSFPSLQNVSMVKLGVKINGALYRVIDAIDSGYPSDGAAIVDCILGGAVPVPLAHNQTMTIGLFAFNGGSGDITLTHSSGECVGYVYGHRVLCDRDNVEDTAESGSGYSFT